MCLRTLKRPQKNCVKTAELETGKECAQMDMTELPLGLSMELGMNEPAMQGYAGLSEAEKEQIILRCKDVKTKKQMQQVVNSLVRNVDIQEVFEEEREHFI